MVRRITPILLLLAVAIQLPTLLRHFFTDVVRTTPLEASCFLASVAAVLLMSFRGRFPGGLSAEKEKGVGFRYVFVLAACAILIGVGTWLGSPRMIWIGSVFLLALSATSFWKLSTKTAINLGILGSIFPLSFSVWDPSIHSVGQRLASSLAGALLDWVKVFYYVRGNVIGLVSKDFLENAQCSGLRLLGPSLLMVFGYGFSQGYSIFRMIYLVVQCLFWIIVANAIRIFIMIWIQDGTPEVVDPNWFLSDSLGLLGILFFCWSGDQFWSAFTYREKEEVVVSTADGFNASSRSNEQAEPATYAAWIVTLFIGILGIVNWPQGVSVPKDATSSLRLHLLFSQADPSFQDLSIAPAIKSPESFTPIFRQTALWPQEEWEIREVEGGQPLGKLRIDGLWLKPVDADWLWRWYGWKTKLLDAEGSRKIWSLSRTIGEEGIVVNDWLPISGSDGPKLMISLIGESVRPLGEKDQTRLLKLFDRLRERIESVIAAN